MNVRRHGIYRLVVCLWPHRVPVTLVFLCAVVFPLGLSRVVTESLISRRCQVFHRVVKLIELWEKKIKTECAIRAFIGDFTPSCAAELCDRKFTVCCRRL